MTDAIEDLPNIGAVLGKRLRTVGITTADEFQALGDDEAFSRLIAHYPEDACTHTRLALAGAARNQRWHDLPKTLRATITKGLK